MDAKGTPDAADLLQVPTLNLLELGFGGPEPLDRLHRLGRHILPSRTEGAWDLGVQGLWGFRV